MHYLLETKFRIGKKLETFFDPREPVSYELLCLKSLFFNLRLFMLCHRLDQLFWTVLINFSPSVLFVLLFLLFFR